MMKEKIKILIVEDEVIVAMRFEIFFVRRGYEVYKTVASGEEAVEIAALEKPDVVLMDINLKGELNGIQAAEQIVEKFNVPIIFMTGYSDAELRKQAEKLNPLGYFLKPVNMNEIFYTIDNFTEI
jgi:two-component system, response regulator PdtaR